MSELPPACAIAFKEWDGVCRALLEGRQSLLVRKGGIEEEGGVFRPEHPAFWLYPTRVHQAEQGLRESWGLPSGPVDPAHPIELRGLAHVDRIARVSETQHLAALMPYHVWTEETILKRYRYREPGLWVLAVRVYRREPAVTLIPTPEQLGCKSWVGLEAPLETAGASPVVGDVEWKDRLDSLSTLLPWEDQPA
ncbi:hypothetical protein OJF2_52810 [Aquisphaera giovannonii]|uniref:DUF1802 family protein n=1 Tax=Aquisphaera giovannonii TaxID=406548 RepID=A0A5B9W7N9_9BACT|nr:DUF1802 family protein [Aquisphaera giovannonii]QEH36696.1 hypothetical protein OJF2_52810 [Aquisphaera giovannonii]